MAAHQRTGRSVRSAWGATKRGVSSDQVPVLTASDNADEVYEVVPPSMTAIETALDGRIARGSVICSNGALAHLKAAVKAGAEHRRVVVQTIVPAAVEANPVPTKRRKNGRLGLRGVNAHHGNSRC